MAADKQRTHDEAEDFHLLLSSLLAINAEQFSYTDDQGKTRSDPLKQFKALENIYIKNIKPDLKNNKFSEKQLKIVLFFSFYAINRNSAAFREYLAADLMPIYLENTDSFLEILSELPFLIESNCDRLNAYFGFEGKHLGEKDQFIKNNEPKFQQHLGEVQMELCFGNFTN